jgi:hypothetical protein
MRQSAGGAVVQIYDQDGNLIMDAAQVRQALKTP